MGPSVLRMVKMGEGGCWVKFVLIPEGGGREPGDKLGLLKLTINTDFNSS